MIDNNTLDLIKEYLNTRERSNMDSELSDILVVRKLLFISILQNLILSKKAEKICFYSILFCTFDTINTKIYRHPSIKPCIS